MSKPQLVTIAFAVLFAFMAASLLGSPAWAGSAAIASAVCLTVWGVQFVRERRSRRFDLEALRQLQEREELDEIELPEIEDNANQLCLSCGQPFNPAFGVCPYCRSSR